MLELYADTAPACEYAHKGILADAVHTLAVDWHPDSHSDIKTGIQTDGLSSHKHIQFNLDLLRLQDLEEWTWSEWGVPPSAVDWVHLSFDCSTQSLASAATQKHRGPPALASLCVGGDMKSSDGLSLSCRQIIFNYFL